MTNEELIREIKQEACCCNHRLEWTCRFCEELLPVLRMALSPIALCDNDVSQEHLRKSYPGIRFPEDYDRVGYKPQRLPKAK